MQPTTPHFHIDNVATGLKDMHAYVVGAPTALVKYLDETAKSSKSNEIGIVQSRTGLRRYHERVCRL